jgi:hypothetical protein
VRSAHHIMIFEIHQFSVNAAAEQVNENANDSPASLRFSATPKGNQCAPGAPYMSHSRIAILFFNAHILLGIKAKLHM